MHREHGETPVLRPRRVRYESEDEEVEAVVEPRVVDGMRRLAREARPQTPELRRPLQRREERRIGAGEVLGDAELLGDRIVQGGRTGRRDGIASAATAGGFGID